MNKKIDQSRKAKKEFKSPILTMLKSDKRIPKATLMAKLNTDDRMVRQMISDVSMHYAVISHSMAKGYRLARPIETLDIAELEIEINEVNTTINELQSRVRFLKAKMKPLIAYLKVAERERDARMAEVRDSLPKIEENAREIFRKIIIDLGKHINDLKEE